MKSWQPPQRDDRENNTAASIHQPSTDRLVKSLSRRSFGRRFGLFLAGVGMSSAIAACANTGTPTSTADAGADAGAAKPPIELTLVSYAVTQAAYEQIIPKFVEQWKQEHNQEVIFNQSYGGSGSQTRAVLDGLDADVVALALALDTQKLEDGGLIEPGWETEAPNDSIVHKSVAVIITREGNPKNIQGWEDLTRDDVQVVTANPKTSGGARWNYLALWGAVTQKGGSEAAAEEFVTNVYKHVPVLPKDAREATDVFYSRGQGDALINYENEVLLAKQKGEDQPFIIPEATISIDNPIAVVDANVDKHGTREVAEAFVAFLFTPEAQREFAKVGFRPVDPTVAEEFASQYPPVETLFTVSDLGGWDTIQEKFFKDGAVFDQIQAKIGK
ncbi:sulfate ABC transporter substrate-binding protein [Pseudanabaena sp. FACHB-2040]|uniref:sulfate ABC transporter substrate-binding protein n=1 Tax=Pseudanabaena sp. FACHB-2040 TaxID=2692859 RepID=UPI0016823DC5|nr:sulfate ABC transporter substrate-binding protein [Pseudanabaena sp. FACHB-2040]MBD2260828.1 sulfate ABC transporter substrate-binding protein [Pseudanabaena sp. FACHB-2040]